MSLYSFSKLEEFLDRNNYPSVDKKSGFEVIKKDLTKEENAGNVEYKSDGIYININGNSQKGYLYLKFPNVKDYGYPKAHLVECSTIKDQKKRGSFHNRYFWYNGALAEIIDRITKQQSNVALDICYYCINKLHNAPKNTQDFHEENLKLYGNQNLTEEISLDIFGYTREWQQISKQYRERMNYTCGKCSLKIENALDRRFLHVDHIDGDKLNNVIENLQVLCILCHSQKDTHHQLNFSKPLPQKELKSFLDKFSVQLKKLNNPYL